MASPDMLEVIAAQFYLHGGDDHDPGLVNGISTVTALALVWILCTSPVCGARRKLARNRTAPDPARYSLLPSDTPNRLVDAPIAVCASNADALFASGLEAVINGCVLLANLG